MTFSAWDVFLLLGMAFGITREESGDCYLSGIVFICPRDIPKTLLRTEWNMLIQAWLGISYLCFKMFAVVKMKFFE